MNAITDIYASAAISDAVSSYVNPALTNRQRPEDTASSKDSEPVKLNLSSQAQAAIASNKGESVPVTPPDKSQSQNNSGGENGKNSSQNSSQEESGGQNLSQSEKQTIKELQARDREVRNHEMQHVSAAGPYAKGGPVYEYQKGPDNKMYAVGGHVNVDTSPVPGNPEATLAKARVLQASATAPSESSSADRGVAADALAMASQAKADISSKSDSKTDSSEKTAKNKSMLASAYGLNSNASTSARTKQA